MRVLQVTPQFEKDWHTVPEQVKDIAGKIGTELCANPVGVRLGVKKLQGILPPVWRVRIGQYRLVYSFTKTAVILHRIRHRKDVYRAL